MASCHGVCLSISSFDNKLGISLSFPSPLSSESNVRVLANSIANELQNVLER